MEAQLISLLRTRPLVTVREAVCVLNTSESDVRAAFAAMVDADAGAYALLRDATVEGDGEAARGSPTTKGAPQKVGEADAFALLSLSYPKHAAISVVPAALCPAVRDTLHVYPVVSRAILESRPENALRAAPVPIVAAPAVKSHTAASAVAPPAVKVEAAAPVAVKVEVVTPPATPRLPPVLRAAEVQAPVPCAPEAALPPAVVEPPVVAAAPAVSAPPPAAAAVVSPSSPSPRTSSVFDMMKQAAAATKRPRTGEDAPVKSKKATTTAKAKKAAKTENTTSLAKLARASRKKNAGATPTASAAATSFLDDDDGDAMNGFSNSEESTRAETEAIQEETPVLDVVEVSASNDDVILCDDAPPLAFCPAPPPLAAAAANATVVKRDAPVRKCAAAAAESGAAQATLGSFFNAAVVAFQRSFKRGVQTEMKVEDGEYICADAPCYTHMATGEVISEEEYYQRTAQLARQHESLSVTPAAKSAGAVAESPPSPAAKSAERSSSGKAEKAKPLSPAPTKTLLSFFKPTA